MNFRSLRRRRGSARGKCRRGGGKKRGPAGPPKDGGGGGARGGRRRGGGGGGGTGGGGGKKKGARRARRNDGHGLRPRRHCSSGRRRSWGRHWCLRGRCGLRTRRETTRAGHYGGTLQHEQPLLHRLEALSN